MKANLLIRKTISLSLTVAIMATYSMVTLASNGKFAGEIRVVGSDQSAEVSVNGESVKSNRSIFSSSTIVTPANASAVIDLGSSGKLAVAPSTVIRVTFDKDSASALLSSGNVTVLSTENGVQVDSLDGTSALLKAGESSGTAAKQDDDDDNGGSAWWLWALVLGGAAAGMIYVATKDSNSADLGGSGTVVSPTS